jgi:hypothetical protein
MPLTKSRSLAAQAAATLALLLGMTSAGAAVSVATVAQGEKAVDKSASPAAVLRARYEEIRPQLERNHFGKPLFLESQEGNSSLKGDVYGVVDHSFERVSAALAEAADWCHVLILPYNTKRCASESARTLALYVGRKSQEPIERAYRIDFVFHPVARSADYLRRQLKAEAGPLGTHDYTITLEATPLDATHSLIHLSYAYSFGTMSRLAMQTYLATSGSSKVGFSMVEEGGARRYIGGMRGVMERNTMRYYLAIDAYLNSLSAPPPERLEKRLNEWFAHSEKYRRQLWEMDRAEYLSMKRSETQQVARAPS